MGQRSLTFVCAPCRATAKLASPTRPRCPRCRCDMRNMGTRFRPPAARDDAAWRRLAAGDWATERSSVERREAAQTARDQDWRGVIRRLSPHRPQPSGRFWRIELEVRDGTLTAAQAERELLEVASSPDPDVRRALALLDRLPDSVAAALLADKNEDVAWLALRHAAPEVRGADRAVRRAARSKRVAARAAAACVPTCPPGLLAELARDRSEVVARPAVANPGLPFEALLSAPADLIDRDAVAHAWTGWVANLDPERRARAEALTEPALLLLGQVWPTREVAAAGRTGDTGERDSVSELLEVCAAVIGC